MQSKSGGQRSVVAGLAQSDDRASPSNAAKMVFVEVSHRCTYLLPIRRAQFDAAETAQLADYFRGLTEGGCEVLVVDGSPAETWSEHHAVWGDLCRHESVDRQFTYLNDKVNGIHTGVQLATCDKIILADDDIRYTTGNLDAICDLLESAEVVRPQNFISPLPWWAKMEAARMLINRATLRIGDYPGTCAFRREAILRVGHYDGDVLFDNEEIIRHFAREGALIAYAIDLFVRKRPPGLQKWREQRPRQAYEDFPLRAKTALFFLLPIGALLTAINDRRAVSLYLLATMLGSLALAFWGRARGAARKHFSPAVCFFAPLWIWERSLSTYWALYWYLVRGGYPFGDKLLSKGVGRDWFAGRPAVTTPRADK